MKKIFFMALTLLVCVSCGSKLDPEKAKECVILGEKDHLPLLLQRLDDVENITIDSMRIRCADEPMDGYLYTTWTIKKSVWSDRSYDFVPRKEVKSIIIVVSNIRNSKEHDGYVEWQTDWASAYVDAKR